jgi:hypothetical protein
MMKKLGKIKNVRFGLGGYNDAMIGIHFEFGGEGWGVNHSRSYWDPNLIEHTVNCQWTESDRTDEFSKIMGYISNLLEDGKVDSIDKLKGKPIEVELDGNILKEWRILTEVL